MVLTPNQHGRAIKTGFPPVADASTEVLILGSLPGDASLVRGQYYGHPRNQFWRLMGAVIAHDLEGLAYGERLAALNAAGFGLWDVIRSGLRAGSLDAHIRSPEPNALAALIETLPRLRRVAFNGAKASALGRKLIAPRSGLDLVTLPSSSPAHAVGFETKREAWLRGLETRCQPSAG